MPRKTYPSDHRRYFRVMEDVLDNPGYRSMRLEDRAVWIDILATFNRLRAQDSGDAKVFSWDVAMPLLSSRTRPAALQRCRRVTAGTSLEACCVPEGLLLRVPNYSELQGLTPAGLPRSSAVTPSPTPTPTPTPTQKKRESDPSDPTPALKDSGLPKGKKKPEPAWALEFADHFVMALRTHHDRPKIPDDLKPWARSARLMVERDGRTEEDLKSLARWLFDGTSGSESAAFWRPNILSVGKFRAKYDQMNAQRQREKTHATNQRQRSGGNSELGRQAREFLRANPPGDDSSRGRSSRRPV